MSSDHPAFSSVPGLSIASSVRKAKVRAALFRKLEPVRIGRFVLLERLGAGAMGEIYAAYDEQLDRRVALKLVRHGSDLTTKADALLMREAQTLARVSHPNVVHVYEVGTHDGRLFIAMELVHGQTLTQWLEREDPARQPQRQREILRRFIAAGRGLEAAHRAGVAHRDFKPDNILVGDDGRVCVVDFGLARALVPEPAATGSEQPDAGEPERALDPDASFEHARTIRSEAASRGDRGILAPSPLDPLLVTNAPTLGHEPGAPSAAGRGAAPDLDPAPATPPELKAATRLTQTGTVMGTPRFMAPEQLRGALADHRSDQFSFCIALYHALYGTFPFPGERIPDLLVSIESGQLALEHGTGMAARVRKALRRGLSLDPSQRFASMGELLAALESSARRRRGWVAGAVLLCLAAVLLWLRPASAAPPCATAGQAIEPSWSPVRQVAVHAAFLRTDRPYAETAWRGTKQRLDGYTGRWRDGAIAACRDTYVDRVQSGQKLDRRMLCLDRGRIRLEALVSELTTGAQDAVPRAIEAVATLPDLALCSRTESILFGVEPPPVAVAAQVAAVRDRLARAVTLEVLGRTEESLAVARDALGAAARLTYPPVHAEALAQVARALDRRDVTEARIEARALYFQALNLAEAHRHDELAAAIWSRLVLLATEMDPGMQQAYAWWDRSEAAVLRSGGGAFEVARLHYARSEIAYRDGKYAEASNQASLAIAAISGVPDSQLELSRYYDALAKALEPQNQTGSAIELHEKAFHIASDTLGPAHPDVIKLQMNYGKALQKQGRFDQARTVLEAALAIMPAADRASHIDAGKLHMFLSDLSYVEDRLDDATSHAQAGLQIYLRAGAPEHLLAEAYKTLGNAEQRRKHFASALEMFRHALELRRGHLASDHPQLGVNEGSIAEALIGLARYDEALPHVVEAERIFERGGLNDRRTRAWILTLHGDALAGQRRFSAAVPVLEQALPLFDDALDLNNPPRARWALARSLHALGGAEGRVRQLAERARDQFAKLGVREAENRDAVGRFLDQLPPAAHP